MRRYGVVALLGASLIDLVSAQATTLSASTSYVPTNTWAPQASCSQAAPGGPGGYYQDSAGTYWEVQCAQRYSGVTYYDNNNYVGTNGQGIGACFWGCSNRIGCVGFTYTGSVTSANVGSGRCYHFYKDTQGTLGPATGATLQLGGQDVYAAAYLLQASPGTLCPFYDGQNFTSPGNVVYTVRCGYQGKVGAAYPYAAAVSTTSVRNYMSCINACDAAGATNCQHVNFQYATVLEPAINNVAASTLGGCTFITGYATPSGGPNARYAMAIKATAASTTSAAYSVPTQACPANDGQQFTDSLGVAYTQKCYSDTSGGSQYLTGTNVYSFNDCAYICSSGQGLTAPATCAGVTYLGVAGANGVGGGTCYVKTDPTVIFNNDGSSGKVALIKVARYGAWTSTTTTTPAGWVRSLS